MHLWFWPLSILLFWIFGCVPSLDRALNAEAKLHTTSAHAARAESSLRVCSWRKLITSSLLDWHENLERKFREENTRCSLHSLLIPLTLSVNCRKGLSSSMMLIICLNHPKSTEEHHKISKRAQTLATFSTCKVNINPYRAYLLSAFIAFKLCLGFYITT